MPAHRCNKPREFPVATFHEFPFTQEPYKPCFEWCGDATKCPEIQRLSAAAPLAYTPENKLQVEVGRHVYRNTKHVFTSCAPCTDAVACYTGGGCIRVAEMRSRAAPCPWDNWKPGRDVQ